MIFLVHRLNQNIIDLCLDTYIVAMLQIDLKNDKDLAKEFAIVPFL